VITFPNCKINLGLSVTGKRPDGYHNLETIFLPVNWKDAVEVIQTEKEPSNEVTGIQVDADPKSNLVLKAYQLLRSKFDLPKLQFHLHKSIPIGAGLGGGSADAAFCLRLLNEKFNLKLTQEQLLDDAAELGSDCAFFIINQPCYASGRGEILKKIDLPFLTDLFIMIVYPGIHISTAWAFSQINPEQKASLREVIEGPIENWKSELNNDFEEAVFAKHPEIRKIKEELYAAGALYASMSGSGSSVYGFFRTLPGLSFPDQYVVKVINPLAAA